MASALTVAVAQPEIESYCVAANAHQHARLIAAAAARLVVFPEMSLTGYELDAEPIGPGDPRLDPIADACAQAGAVALVGGPVRDRHGPHIATIRVDASTREVAYRKQMLGGREPGHFSPGPRPALLELDGWRIGLGICKDTGSPLHIAATARLGIDLYVAGLVHRPEERAEQDARGFLLARTCRSYVAFASFAGTTGDVFSQTLGTSTIWSPDGTPLARASDQPGDLVSVKMELPLASQGAFGTTEPPTPGSGRPWADNRSLQPSRAPRVDAEASSRAGELEPGQGTLRMRTTRTADSSMTRAVSR